MLAKLKSKQAVIITWYLENFTIYFDILWKYLIAANKKTVLIFMTECFSDLINVIILYFIVNLS